MGPQLLCVPNVSEGRDPLTLEALADAIGSAAGVRLLDRHADPDHHRAVYTFAGPPEAVLAAALAAARVALERIDMRQHHGVHPRLGAVDVVPFVPAGGLPMAVAVGVAHRFGATLAAEAGIPVFYYGAAARRPERQDLPRVRRGQYESLAARFADPAEAPDEGPARFLPRSGATAVGAREPLVAFNVWLDTAEVEVARAIARAVRASSGGLPGVQAMGVFLASRGCAQVSMNLVEPRATSLYTLLGAVTREAACRGVGIRRLELVGLCPEAALREFRQRGLDLPGFGEDRVLERALGDP